MKNYRVEFYRTDKKQKVLPDGSKFIDVKTEYLGGMDLGVSSIPDGLSLMALAFRRCEDRYSHANKVKITELGRG